MLTYQSVLLDLDGTLVDSAPGIVSTIAFTLKEMGREVPTMPELLRWVGPPLPQSFEVRGQMSPSEAREAVTIYRGRYLDVGVYDAKLFDGVADLLIGLRDAGAHLA
ncbi:MAG: HAD hydrolase-like protein, partial [Pontimonas sp.]|nr:HAD hydrolase-like protein [Pontimonas sp.]